MNPVLAHCNKCYNIPSPGADLQFFLTSCGNVFCQKCLAIQGVCKKCGKSCPRRVITSPDVVHLFQDTSSKIISIQKTLNFQSNRYNAFFKYTNARHVSMERALNARDSKIQLLQSKVNELNNTAKKMKEQQQHYQKQHYHQQRETSFQAPFNKTDSIMNISRRSSNHSPYGIFPRESYQKSPALNHQGRPVHLNIQRNLSIDQIYQSTPLPSHGRPSLRRNFIGENSISISGIRKPH